MVKNQKLSDHLSFKIKEQAKQLADSIAGEANLKFNTSDYAEGWTIKKGKSESTYIVYNKTKPGLAHLLENGHVVTNKKGKSMGHYEGEKHIAPAVQEHALQFKKEITREVQKYLQETLSFKK